MPPRRRRVRSNQRPRRRSAFVHSGQGSAFLFFQNCHTRAVRVLSDSRESESGHACFLTLSSCLAAAVAAVCCCCALAAVVCTAAVSVVARSTSSVRSQTDVVVKAACGACSLPLGRIPWSGDVCPGFCCRLLSTSLMLSAVGIFLVAKLFAATTSCMSLLAQASSACKRFCARSI